MNYRTAGDRKGRLQTEWSLANAQLGGVKFKDHPWCATLDYYIKHAPYRVQSRDWAKFRKWMKARVNQARVFGG